MEGDAGRRRGMTVCRPFAWRAERGMSLERLDRWSDTLDPPARVEGVSMLDGYLTAIVVGPHVRSHRRNGSTICSAREGISPQPQSR
jgi:hypothetical protein